MKPLKPICKMAAEIHGWRDKHGWQDKEALRGVSRICRLIAEKAWNGRTVEEICASLQKHREERERQQREYYIRIAKDFAGMLNELAALPKNLSRGKRHREILRIASKHPLATSTPGGQTCLAQEFRQVL